MVKYVYESVAPFSRGLEGTSRRGFSCLFRTPWIKTQSLFVNVNIRCVETRGRPPSPHPFSPSLPRGARAARLWSICLSYFPLDSSPTPFFLSFVAPILCAYLNLSSSSFPGALTIGAVLSCWEFELVRQLRHLDRCALGLRLSLFTLSGNLWSPVPPPFNTLFLGVYLLFTFRKFSSTLTQWRKPNWTSSY